ncbi:hypothetical protein ACQ858_12085 [Variovorax ureilyticus]|uniref:hypothetical protein n=1 Tax=Variovorax ureilyticus TaxID=1836198 RepID=UPI003D6775B5
MTAEQGEAQLDRLASDAAPVYEDAFRWFRAQGPAAAPLLLRGLDDRALGPTGRWRVLLLLRELALPSTLPAVLGSFREALAQGDPVVLPGAMEALAAIDAEDAISGLVEVLDGGNADFVNHAAVLLGDRVAGQGRGAAAAQSAIVGLLESPLAASRASAVRGLLRAATPLAIDALRRHRAIESDPQVLELLKGLR